MELILRCTQLILFQAIQLLCSVTATLTWLVPLLTQLSKPPAATISKTFMSNKQSSTWSSSLLQSPTYSSLSSPRNSSTSCDLLRSQPLSSTRLLSSPSSSLSTLYSSPCSSTPTSSVSLLPATSPSWLSSLQGSEASSKSKTFSFTPTSQPSGTETSLLSSQTTSSSTQWVCGDPTSSSSVVAAARTLWRISRTASCRKRWTGRWQTSHSKWPKRQPVSTWSSSWPASSGQASLYLCLWPSSTSCLATSSTGVFCRTTQSESQVWAKSSVRLVYSSCLLYWFCFLRLRSGW